MKKPTVNFLRQLLCGLLHNEWKFIRNIYGDEIIAAGWRRSIWRCQRCGKHKYEKELHTTGEISGYIRYRYPEDNEFEVLFPEQAHEGVDEDVFATFKVDDLPKEDLEEWYREGAYVIFNVDDGTLSFLKRYWTQEEIDEINRRGDELYKKMQTVFKTHPECED